MSDLRTGFFQWFNDWARPQTDAPQMFLDWASMMTISGAIGNKVWFPTGDRELHSNLWVVIMGKSTEMRKTTAVSFARRLLEDANASRIISMSTTMEALYPHLEKTGCGTIFASEYAAWTKGMEKEYSSGLMELLTDFYDVPKRAERKLKSAEYELERPAISIFAASTPDWFLRRLSAEKMASGFMARFAIVPAYKKSRFIALPPPGDSQIRQYLVNTLKGISMMEPRAMTLERRDIFESWAREVHFRMRESRDDTWSSYAGRMTFVAIKIAMIKEISRYHWWNTQADEPQDNDVCVVSEESLLFGISKVEQLLIFCEDIMSDEAGETPWEQKRNPVVRILREAGTGGLYFGEIVKRVRMQARVVQDVLDTLLIERTATQGRESAKENIDAWYYRGDGWKLHHNYEEGEEPRTPEAQEQADMSDAIKEYGEA